MNKKWYHCNDTNVSSKETVLDSLVGPQAYCFFIENDNKLFNLEIIFSKLNV